jgi:hypothetical protein
MYTQKIIWSWVLFIAALLVHGYFQTYESKMMSLFLFGGIIGILRRDIERGRMVEQSFSYLWDLSTLARALIAAYLLIMSVLLLWLGFNQPGTLDTLFYGENGLFMLFMVLSPLMIPLFWKVIKLDLQVISNERT